MQNKYVLFSWTKKGIMIKIIILSCWAEGSRGRCQPNRMPYHCHEGVGWVLNSIERFVWVRELNKITIQHTLRSCSIAGYLDTADWAGGGLIARPLRVRFIQYMCRFILARQLRVSKPLFRMQPSTRIVSQLLLIAFNLIISIFD